MKKILLSMCVALSAFAPAFAGSGTAADPYTCAQVRAMTDDIESAYVKGYIVGNAPGQELSSAIFTTEGAKYSNILLADDANCKDYNLCVPVQLVSKTDIRSKLNLGDNPGNLGKELVIAGNIAKYFGVKGVKAPTAYTLEGGSSVEPTPDPAGAALYESASGADFTFDNIELGTLSKVWSLDTNYGCLKASAFNKACIAADSWALSPVLDFSKVTKAELSFDHAVNKFTPSGNLTIVKEQVSLAVRVDGGAWATLEIPTWGTANNWTFVNSGNIDLTAYAGKKIQIGFHYTSTTESAGTWEIKNIKITGEGSINTEEPVVENVKVANIAAFLQSANTNDTYEFTSPVTAVVQGGNYLYVQDATSQMLVYGKLNQTYAKGDVIPAGFTGKYSVFHEAPQFASPAGFAASTAKADVRCEEMSLEEVAPDMVAMYAKFEGVTIKSDGTNYTAEQDGVEVALYDQFKITPATGENLTLFGIITGRDNVAQILPIEITTAGGVVVEAVAAPTFSPAAGAVAEGTLVTIATTTEGASIYYTLDGTEPTAESTLYTEPIEITEAVTIKAIAMKEGLESSSVVEAAYTLKAPDTYKGNFNSFNNGKIKTTYSTYTNAKGWTALNSQIVGGSNEAGKADSNSGLYSFIGDADTRAVVMNGKTSAVGEIQSPVLTDGLGTLTFKYGLPFADTKIDFTVSIINAKGDIIASEVVAPANVEKQTAYEFAKEFNIAGDFKINIKNNCPSSSADNNKDRTAIWNVTWTNFGSAIQAVEATEAAAAPVEYYNLQGVRVANPEAGIYIRRQGSKVEKVIIK